MPWIVLIRGRCRGVMLGACEILDTRLVVRIRRQGRLGATAVAELGLGLGLCLGESQIPRGLIGIA